MVATRYSRKAFVIEFAQPYKWLDVYIWSDAAWRLLMTYFSSPKENAGVSSLRAVVVDVFCTRRCEQGYRCGS
jgi:hypothetical protein